ncbi:uncharacterized protein FOMMEDRAFT_163985 [Fomitiporia mediterranea MF3/22]|uniref:Uncharacterized protein n=1 Tax=Fomitiporia mediterranea (strain MF3/22) TaxID=694068 RepID=R7SIB0_FOMME|nr:uncharacterized protein FOMMEDRAFT_163985 [Fomitiporia mediterranea MF3/22]EJC97314.1 hypothetical protein FOMMEDRAFT_163985 [Fomitiporia mediterranea MF3/22]
MSSHSAARATINEHTLTTMFMYDHSQGAIPSPTPCTLSFPTYHSMLDITLDGPTPHAFKFPTESVHTFHFTLSLRARRPRDTPLQSSAATTRFTAPPFLRRSQSMQRARTDTASPAAQISSFNTADLNPGAPLFLATQSRATSAIRETSQHSPYAHAIQLAGPSDDPSVVTKTTLFGLRCIPPLCRECRLRKNEAVAVVIVKGNPVAQRQRQADLSKTISNQSRLLSVEECKYWDNLAKQWKKGTRRCGLEHK